ncbi:helix-turn-helix transcriptional regulator [Nocardia altamirensis]|uniref:helix-turn-helix transcriptional regulator n=1 Tax=Nocardia altamirensis TaxID=472158 RepID=UPI0008407C88|nr:response regulator transcription factor [Nocardia altamirensis]
MIESYPHHAGRAREGFAHAGQQSARSAETSPQRTVFVHPGLRECLDSANALWEKIFAPSCRIEFADYPALTGRDDLDGAPILLPVNTEYQAENLRAVRARHAMGLIVAVTNDITGHSTYFAIRSGANFVVNLAISGDRQAEILRGQLREHARTTQPATAPTPLAATGGTRRPAAVRDLPTTKPRRRTLDDSDKLLIQMLRSSMTVAEIARHCYMSERSMYRRIRQLYDKVGVASRAELVRSSSGDDPGLSVTVLSA